MLTSGFFLFVLRRRSESGVSLESMGANRGETDDYSSDTDSESPKNEAQVIAAKSKVHTSLHSR